MSLLELQRRMSEDVRRPLTPNYEMQEVAEDGRPVAGIAEAYIKPNDRLTSFERLEIYNQQYWFRVIGAVSEDFPALNAVLGQKKFDSLILAYLKNNSSMSWTLRDLGAKLPDFLSSHVQLAGKRPRLAVDVARLEWAYVDAFDGRVLPPLAPADAQDLGTDSKVSLQPHLQLLALRYPVDDIVLAVRRDTPETDIVSSAASHRKAGARIKLPVVKQQQVFLAVHRFDDSVYYRRIEPETFLLFSALRAGASLGKAIARAFVKTKLTGEQQASLIQESFAHASELGWLCLADRCS
ncbi:MAG: DNA-binding domain-containing protein [Edaphobacter sp.]